MKITPSQYSQTLYDLVQDKTEQEIESIIKKFIQILIKNNDIVKINKIIEKFNNLWDTKACIIEAEITSAKELNNDTVLLLNKFIASSSAIKIFAIFYSNFLSEIK